MLGPVSPFSLTPTTLTLIWCPLHIGIARPPSARSRLSSVELVKWCPHDGLIALHIARMQSGVTEPARFERGRREGWNAMQKFMHVSPTPSLKARWVLDLSCMQLRKASCCSRLALARSLGRVGSERGGDCYWLYSRVEAAEPEPISLSELKYTGFTKRKENTPVTHRVIDLWTHFSCTPCLPYTKLGIHRFHDLEGARSLPNEIYFSSEARYRC